MRTFQFHKILGGHTGIPMIGATASQTNP